MSEISAAEIDEIWANDKLNRRNYADFLYGVIRAAQINNDEDNALIFSIDGDWGVGKSFFIDLWQQQLEKDGHLVSRFDAWKNDIIDDPLIGFISHIYAHISSWQDKLPMDESISEQVIKKAEDVIGGAKERILPICTEIVKGLARKGASYLISEEAVDFILEKNKQAEDADETVENAVALQLIENKIIAHSKNIKIIEEFKLELSRVASDLTERLNKKKPVVVFIDELDRCRPDYAVRLLEVLKHIFNSKGICFVASANITQLEHSIKTIYGAEFDAELYLDRFFNYRLSLPTPSIEDYVKSMSYFDFLNVSMSTEFNNLVDSTYGSAGQFLISNHGRELDDALHRKHFFIYKTCKHFQLNLREIKNLFGKLELICGFLKEKWKGTYVIHDLVFLILAFVHKNKKIKRHDFDLISSWPGKNSNILNSLIHEEIILYGRSNLQVLSLKKVIDFFRQIEAMASRMNAHQNELVNNYHANLAIFSSVMNLNISDDKSIIEVKRILASYIDACFMAATIDKNDVAST
jgi:hypothetical protein